jgi:hypothetical protein
MRLHCYLNVTSIYSLDLTANFGYFTTRILPTLSLGVVHLTLCRELSLLYKTIVQFYRHYCIFSIMDNYSLEIEKSLSA